MSTTDPVERFNYDDVIVIRRERVGAFVLDRNGYKLFKAALARVGKGWDVEITTYYDDRMQLRFNAKGMKDV